VSIVLFLVERKNKLLSDANLQAAPTPAATTPLMLPLKFERDSARLQLDDAVMEPLSEKQADDGDEPVPPEAICVSF
jgi:hypothetical protein